MSATDEDPLRLIYGYCTHIRVPQWQDKKTVNNCLGCKDKLSSADSKHNCRLCGFIFCQSCTGKFHLPLTFNTDGTKSGTVRVCWKCKEDCVETRIRETLQQEKAKASKSVMADLDGAYKSSTPLKSTSSITSLGLPDNYDKKRKEIQPPNAWVDKKNWTECTRCHVKKESKPHNCRACGQLFCGKCTTKTNLIPEYFEKGGKTSPFHTCDECRFRLIFQHYKPVPKLTIKMEEEKAAILAASAGISEVKNCSVVGCRNRAVTIAGLCTNHAEAQKGTTKTVAPDMSVSICWESRAQQVLAKIPATGTTTLAQIDAAFKKSAPQKELYVYLYKGEPVPENFFDVFNIQKLGQQLLIRTKQSVTGVSKETLALADSVQQIQLNGNEKNPFKRSENDLLQAKKKEEEAAKAKPKFHKPGAIRQGLIKVTPKKPKIEPVNNGSAATVAGPAAAAMFGDPTAVKAPVLPKQGQTVEDLLKSRAKTIFGQK